MCELGMIIIFFCNIFHAEHEVRLCSTANECLQWSQFGACYYLVFSRV